VAKLAPHVGGNKIITAIRNSRSLVNSRKGSGDRRIDVAQVENDPFPSSRQCSRADIAENQGYIVTDGDISIYPHLISQCQTTVELRVKNRIRLQVQISFHCKGAD